jgi:hypothetical protein
MCGLFGVAVGKNNKGSTARQRELFLKDALDVGVVRGKDSTGMFAVPEFDPHEIDYLKLALPGNVFSETKLGSNFVGKIYNSAFMIGHHRAATRGNVDAKSAHPYQHGDITLVHNGTLNKYTNLTDGQIMLTDSEGIAYGINRFGVEETLKNIDGAFALLWHDAGTGNLYAARNDKRPLHIATVEDSDSVFFASEKAMLEWLIARNGMILDECYYIPEKTLVTFPHGEPKNWTKKEVEYFVPPKKHSSHTGTNGSGSSTSTGNTFAELEANMRQQGYYRGKNIMFSITQFTGRKNKPSRGTFMGLTDDSLSIEVEARNVSSHLAKNKGKYFFRGRIKSFYLDNVGWPVIVVGHVSETNVEDMQPVYMDTEDLEKKLLAEAEERSGTSDSNVFGLTVTGPNGEITMQEFNKLTKHGCSNCQKDLLPYMADTITWVDNQTPLCPGCADDWLNNLQGDTGAGDYDY